MTEEEKIKKRLEENEKYWTDRTAKNQAKLRRKNEKIIDKQLIKYYKTAAEGVINDFEATYDKLLTAQEKGKEITTADLYKLDRYWKMQGQLRQAAQKLGDKQVNALTKIFEIHFFDIYYSIALEGVNAFSTIDTEGARKLINAIWTADGKDFKQHVWKNVEKLVETLNDELINCVITGKKTTQLKKALKERFKVSFVRADTLVRTEMSHVQNVAAKQRYEDFGVKEFEVWADKDERLCKICGSLHKKRYPINSTPPVPVHPRCRCSIIPVVE